MSNRESGHKNDRGTAPPDLFILSDLHLSEGVRPESGRTSRLETFFYDQEFANFIDRVIVHATCRRRPIVLILNGDLFDFLAVTHVPNVEERKRLGIHVSRRERKYGLDSEPIKDAWRVRRIVRGHPIFFRALLRFLATGHRIHINRGNHDVELYWPEVQEAFFEELAELAQRETVPISAATTAERMTIHDWFYHEPGRIWVEHGQQYEASNSLRYQLNPVLAPRRADTKHARTQLDIPTGSLFVRYVYNRFKDVDPYSTQVFTLEQYLDVVSTYNVIDLARVLIVHFPFFVRALKKARIFEVSGMAAVSAIHRRRLEALERESDLASQTLERIDTMRKFPLGATKYSVFRDMMKPFLRNVLTVLLIVLSSIGGWMLLFSMIQNTQWLADSVLGKASLMAVLAVVTIVGLFLTGTYLSRRYRHTQDSLHDDLADAAGRVSEALDVPLVAMGHSHLTERRSLRDGAATYVNSGTWTLVRGPWDTVRPFGRQFTFLQVQDDDVAILRWNDAGGRWEPVMFLEDRTSTPLSRVIEDTPMGHRGPT